MSSGAEESHYLHGSEPEEQLRLSLLNDLLNEGSLRALDLRGDEKVLDVGSGLGQLSRAMARRLPHDLRLAAESSAQEIAAALIAACAGFADPGGPVDDDRTVVVVKADA